MTRTTHARSTAAVLLLCSVLVVTAAPAGAAPDDPRSADEFLSVLRDYEDAPALEAYSEMEVMRSQAITAVQIGEFTAADRKRLRAVVAVLDAFTDAYARAQNGSRIASLSLAKETGNAIDRLEAAGGRQYATLARLSLERFYRRQGDALYERAMSIENTSARLRYLDAASTAFKRGGATARFSRVSAQESQLRATYRADLERIRSSLAVATAFRNECGDSCSSPVAAITGLGPGVFDAYQQARRANSAADVARRLVEKHGLSQYASRTASLTRWTSDALLTLAIASTLVMFGYAVVFGLVAALVAARIATWAEDLEGAEVGRIVPAESPEVGST